MITPPADLHLFGMGAKRHPFEFEAQRLPIDGRDNLAGHARPMRQELGDPVFVKTLVI